MTYFLFAVVAVGLACIAWKLTARSAYESPEYTVLTSEGAFEVRDYPTLALASTDMRFEHQGNDGSFMRLFRYIRGSNQGDQVVAMTTPVLMEPEFKQETGRMGFVIPQQVVRQGIPVPVDENVNIRKRLGGRFAAIRFNGRIDSETFASAEARLRNWMHQNGFESKGEPEFAGYDPPWTPGPFRRNEVLIRLNQ